MQQYGENMVTHGDSMSSETEENDETMVKHVSVRKKDMNTLNTNSLNSSAMHQNFIMKRTSKS